MQSSRSRAHFCESGCARIVNGLSFGVPSESPSGSASRDLLHERDSSSVEDGSSAVPPLDSPGNAQHLSFVERAQIRFVKSTFAQGRLSDALVRYQNAVGATWVDFAIKNLIELHGVERFPKLAKNDSFVLVSNHRSFFDMYALTSQLIKRLGVRQRMLFPVRSKFFYDRLAGLAVNGLMSGFAMYPPIFRERERSSLNVASVDETIRLVRAGGTFLGMHPEGKRNPGDPYTFLPARAGVGKIVHACPKALVIPVFVNGLGNDLLRQIRGNFDGSGERILAVFGEPIDFGSLRDEPASPEVFRRISESSMDHVRRLSEEERTYRLLAGR